jgi:hypothetical protein
MIIQQQLPPPNILLHIKVSLLSSTLHSIIKLQKCECFYRVYKYLPQQTFIGLDGAGDRHSATEAQLA